jgi:hypothetical protein
MKRLPNSTNSSRTKKIACTVSAAALMLGVSSAATIGLHFQENYCGSASYSGFAVTMTAFGIESNGWENLIEMPTGYACPIASAPYSYTLNEVVDTTTSTNGLNPLPNGSLNVTWTANDANFSGFAGYGGHPPSYAYDGHYPGANIQVTGEEEIYSTFLRDGVNFGIDTNGNFAYTHCGDNTNIGYLVDITGLKSLFTNGPFVIELIAAADSMQKLTNAFVVDVVSSTTNSVTYPSTPPPYDEDGTCNQWLRGHGGGLSTVTGALNTDHVQIMSSYPQHGGVGVPPTGYNNAGTISGFIVTDQPVVTMSPQTIPLAGPGDTIALSAYAIGVPPLACQWRLNGHNISGATNLSYTIPSANLASGGNYDLVVTNLYGAATSKVSVVTVDKIAQNPVSGVVADSNPVNIKHNGVNMGATWQASSSDGTTTRTGVMDFAAAETNGITVDDSAAFDGTNGTITFWMRSAGTDTLLSGTGGTLLCRATGTAGKDFLLLQQDTGNLLFTDPTGNTSLNSAGGVSDNKWHFVALTFDQTSTGGVAWYIDGVLDTATPNAAPWTWPAGQPLEIGYSTDTATWRPYNGLLNDVRYYSTPLTAPQVATIYSSGALVDTNDLQMQFSFATAPGEGIVLTWAEVSAVLQSAPNVNGPWTDVTGVVSSYTIIPSATQQFFRYRYTTQSWVSNPYLM